MEPTTAIMAATTLMSGVSRLFGANAQKKRARENRRLANLAAAREREALSMRMLQENLAASRATQAAEREGAAAQGLSSASAAAAGVTGQSVDLLREDIGRSVSEARVSIREQNLMTIDQLLREQEAVEVRRRSRIANAQGPSDFATGLGIAGDLLSGAGQYYSFQSRRQRGE